MQRTTVRFLTAALAAVLSLALLGGCFRQHIETTPPGATPATPRTQPVEAAPEPAPAPAAKVEEPAVVIEETYVIDAPQPDAQAAPKSAVKEADLGDESAPAPAAAPAPEQQAAKPAPKAAVAAPDEAAVAAAETAPDLMGEMFYVQVGSFSELENANKVLSSLMEKGYDGSKLSMTDDGSFRVQAGAFTDREGARRALETLLTDYKGAFILKGTPE